MDRTRAPAPRSHVNAPVADLPAKKVTIAHHFVADLTSPYGRVIYDYNREGASQLLVSWNQTAYSAARFDTASAFTSCRTVKPSNSGWPK